MAAAAAIMTGVAAGALAVAAAAQASWTPIVTLTGHTWEGTSPVISVDGSGGFLMAWSGLNNKAADCYSQIQLRTRYRTGSLGSIRTLTPCGPPMDFPAVASNANGDGIVAWFRSDNHGIQARRVSPTGRIGRVITVTPSGYQSNGVAVAMSPSGLALAVWNGPNPKGGNVLGRFIAANGALGPVLQIGGGLPQTPSVVFDRTGTATVAWADASFSRALARRITPKSLGKVAVILAPTPSTAAFTTFGVPRIADDSNGDTFLLTSVNVSSKSNQVQHLVFRKWTRAGRLGPAVTVAKPVDSTALAVDGAGDAVIVWSAYISRTQSAVYGRRVSRAGTLGHAVRLGTGFLPEAAVDPIGSGIITWQSTPFDSGRLTRVYGRRVSASAGKFGALLELTSNGQYAQLAVDPAGKFGVIWEGSTIGWPVQARFGP